MNTSSSEIQFTSKEIDFIKRDIKPPINLLVFGMGNDSKLWIESNPGGRTVFIEDNVEWFDKIKSENPGIEAYLYDYDTKLKEIREDFQIRFEEIYPDSIEISSRWCNEDIEIYLPVLKEKFDVIIVDGPAGYDGDCPGREKSIYMARKCAAPNATVFVHDLHRPAEQFLAAQFLGLAEEFIYSPKSILGRFRLQNR